MDYKKLLIVLPEKGGSRTLGENIVFALTKMGRPPVVFDMGKYLRSLSSVVNGNYELVVDIANQSIVVKALEERVDAVFVVTFALVTQFTLMILKNARIKTLHFFCEDLSEGRLWEPFISLYDHFFIIQKGPWLARCLEKNPSTHFLPNGAPLEALELPPVRKEYDVVFVGSPYANRIRFFEQLAELDVPFLVWGHHWNQHPMSNALKARIMEGERWLTHDEILALYAKSKIVINLHSTLNDQLLDREGDFVNPRAFTIPLCRSLQFSDRREALLEFFTDGKDIVLFDSPESLAEKIKFYLERTDLAQSIMDAAYQTVVKEHLWSCRMPKIFSVLQ